MKRIFSIVIISLVSLSACKKKTGDNEKLDPNDNVTIGDYMPTTVGTWWKFRGNNDGTATTVTRIATGRDSTINNFNYDYFESTDSSSQWVTPEYFAKNGDKYISLIDLDGSRTSYINAVVYKEAAGVGDSWLNTHQMSYGSFNVDVEIRGEVTAVNVTENLNGVDYTNVQKSTNDLYIKNLIATAGLWLKVGTIKMSFKPGVGIIKTDVDINVLAGLYKLKYYDELVEYHIEP